MNQNGKWLLVCVTSETIGGRSLLFQPRKKRERNFNTSLSCGKHPRNRKERKRNRDKNFIKGFSFIYLFITRIFHILKAMIFNLFTFSLSRIDLINVRLYKKKEIDGIASPNELVFL